jgi:hypothetical protein
MPNGLALPEPTPPKSAQMHVDEFGEITWPEG